VPFTANPTALLPAEEHGCATLSVAFPHSDSECDRCGCCKRNLMLTRAADDDVIGYIGDGFSDRCAVHYADMVFAKGELQSFCQRENISYFAYNSFSDVTARLAAIIPGGAFPKRRRAALRRNEAFQGES